MKPPPGCLPYDSLANRKHRPAWRTAAALPPGGYVRVRTLDPAAVICPVFGPPETEPDANLSSYLPKEVVRLVGKRGRCSLGST